MYLHASLQKSVSWEWIFTVGGGGEDKNDYAPREDSSSSTTPSASASAHPFRREGQPACVRNMHVVEVDLDALCPVHICRT